MEAIISGGPTIDSLLLCTDGSFNVVDGGWGWVISYGGKLHTGYGKVDSAIGVTDMEKLAMCHGLIGVQQFEPQTVYWFSDDKHLTDSVKAYMKGKPSKLPDWVLEQIDHVKELGFKIIVNKVQGHPKNVAGISYFAALFKIADTLSKKYRNEKINTPFTVPELTDTFM